MKSSMIFAAGLGLGIVSDVAAQSPGELFETSVRPVLATQCADCHSGQDKSGGLSVATRQDLLDGGISGPAIIPGDPDNSLLIQVVRREVEDLEMPMDLPPLSAREIRGLVDWIRDGAQWPDPHSQVVAVEASLGLSPSAKIFVDSVRPVLEQTCFVCHADEQRGGLRLDSREGMLAGGGRGPAIVPGVPEQSLLIKALRHEGDLRMPRGREKLSDQQIDAIADWIGSGAEWAETAAPVAIARREVTDEERAFWSFRPLSETPVPEWPGEWARTDIDRFIAVMYERQGVTPVGAAAKRDLIRRATHDLIGLPPTPKEVEEFLADDSPDAFEKVLDRLLASEHYGERWGRHWLDVTRYGEDDTRGLGNGGRERYPMAYLHRDWVVKAFNSDMPYDTFAKAQLAADLMPEEQRKDLLPALGFLGQGPWYYDLADPPVARADERHDRVDVTTRGFLGLTVGCARCHDHKYDPIGMHDYYGLAGVFNNTDYHEYTQAEDDVVEQVKKDKEFIKQRERSVSRYLSTEGDQLTAVLTSQASRYMMAAWRVTGKEQIPVDRAASNARLDLEALERWIDFLDDKPKHYPFLKDWQAMIADEGGTEERAKELADALQRLLLEIVAEQQKLEERNRKIIAKGLPLEEVKSVPMPNGFESFFDQHQLELDTMERERFNLFLDVFRGDLDNELDTFFPKPALLRFRGWGLERQLSRAAADHVAAVRKEVADLKKELPDVPFVMGVKDKDEEDLEDIALHIRGNPTNLGEEVPRRFLQVLSDGERKLYTGGSGRLQLAEDIASEPLAARVFVNRVWAWHMGGGIVPTPSNFGFQGAPPTNPDLLEYLTSRFVEGGMKLKPLHKDIMMSAVYQLAAEDHEKNNEVDPGNQYFWRFNRMRLDAEGIRDAMLAVSGELDKKVGGPSQQLGRPNNNRRTIYGQVSRFLPDEYLRTFDFPNPNLSAERRFGTNTPLQALYFMNSPFVKAQAEALVRRLAKESASEAPATEASAENSGNGSDTPRRQEPEPKGAENAGDQQAGGAKPGLPETFHDQAMILKVYPLLYSREATNQEVFLGLTMLAAQRKSWRLKLEEEKAKEAADPEQMGTEKKVPENKGEEAAETDEAEEKNEADLLERQASMNAWVQYARALLSTVEFRFVN